MNFNWTRLVLVAVWLLIGVALLLRDSIGLTWLSDRYPAENLNLGGGLGIAFAGWNAMRWYSGRRRSAGTTVPTTSKPLAPKSTEQRPFEYIPELDFHKPEPETKPPESN